MCTPKTPKTEKICVLSDGALRVIRQAPALLEARVLCEAAASLLKKAGEKIRSTSPPGICIGGIPRGINYHVCGTERRAREMAEWLDDFRSGNDEFCEHGRPPHIVNSGLCQGCGRRKKVRNFGWP